MKTASQILVGIIIFFVIALFLLHPGEEADILQPARSSSGTGPRQQPEPATDVIVSDVVLPVESVPVRDLPTAVPVPTLDREVNPRISLDVDIDRLPEGGIAGGVDPLLAVQERAPAATDPAFGTLILDFDAQEYTYVNPPDTVGDVGPNHYIHMINAGGGSLFKIYTKDGSLLAGPIALDSLWPNDDACSNGAGDPIVLYDPLADRWLMSEFAGIGNHLCVYVSQTADPTGDWYGYDFDTPTFPDYPKYAVWPDAYYVSTNEASPALYALDRARMLAGEPTTSQRFSVSGLGAFSFEALTPSDLDGPTPPPEGAPNFFMRHRDDEAHNAGSNNPGEDYLEIFEFHVDWDTPALSSVTGPFTIAVAEFDSELCGYTSFNCFPQQGSSTTLDPLREVIMFRLQYRNFGSYETLVGNLVTDVDDTDRGGIRWFELRRGSGSGWALYQEGTFSPDSNSRWMGSAAMDSSGNIAVGYNVSSSGMYPGLRYVGRLADDPLGTMPQGEYALVSGTSTNGSNRWGDYSALSVDPADGCTFWFTGMYTEGGAWNTRVGTFRFDACGAPSFLVTAVPDEFESCTGDAALFDVSIRSRNGFSAPVTLSAVGSPGQAHFVPGVVKPPLDGTGSSTLTIRNAEAGTYTFEVRGTAGELTSSDRIALRVDAAMPETAVLITPADGTDGTPTEFAFTWQDVPGTAHYHFELATDAAFTQIVDRATVTTPSHAPAAALASGTLHYWRVKTENGCGVRTSPVYSFRTTAPVCNTHASADVPQTIPSSGSGTLSVTSQLPISGNGRITDVNVLGLRGTHTWIHDLEFELTSPAATNVLLYEQSCSSQNDFSLNLDDEADGSRTWPCPPADGGTYQPTQPLSAFDGEDADGIWTLTANDYYPSEDGGTLDGWSLEICEACLAPDPVTDLQISLGGGEVNLSWSRVSDAEAYEVWIAEDDPFFSAPPGGDCATAANCEVVTTEAYRHGGLGSRVVDYTYVVRAVNSCGASTGNSNRVGAFEYAVTLAAE